MRLSRNAATTDQYDTFILIFFDNLVAEEVVH
jgi:hypothetical protein